MQSLSTKLGHFELLEQISKGRIATLFKAYDPTLNRIVAIRLLDADLARQDPHFVENFIHEAQNAAAINHPNIVPIYFVGEENGNYYIAMELLEGRSLDQIIQEEGPQSEEAVHKIAIQIAGALNAAYANQLVHGDIKPQNIFITNRGVAKLLDFGLAKMANIESASESDGNAWGSAYYISPERVGQKAEDFRSDIYSLGATLFHALVGHPPFDADTPEELALKRLGEKMPALRTMNPAISAKMDKIVARMLNKSAFLRYLDYDKLIADLRASASPSPRKQPAAAVNIPGPQPAVPIKIALRAAPVVITKKPKQLPLVITCVVSGLVLCAGIIILILNSNKVDSTRPVANDMTAASTTPAPVTTYTLATTNGNGGGRYAAGTVVTVTANAPGSGYQFSGWSGDKSTLANPSERTTTLTMPAEITSITATYSLIPTSPSAQAAPTGVAAPAANPTATQDASSKAIPSPWLNQDLRALGPAGSANYAGGIYTISGAGGGAYFLPDTLHYVYRSSGGDCSITARVLTQTNTDRNAKTGVMIRESLGTSSAFADMVVTPRDMHFQSRDSSGHPDDVTMAGTAPYWVRVIRVGNTFTGYVSADGATWTQVGTKTLTMASSAYIGLVQSSGLDGTLGVASFDNVTVGGGGAPVAPTGFGAAVGKVGL